MAADDQAVTVMCQSVQGGARQQSIAKHLRPFLKGPIARDGYGLALVSLADDLIEVFGRLRKGGGGGLIDVDVIVITFVL